MARVAVLAAVALLCAVGALGARMPGDVIASMHSDSFPSGLANTVSSLKAVLLRSVSRKGEERREEMFEDTHISTIRFTVPPSLADEFEDEWLDLEKDVSKEKKNMIFDLKKTKLDNLFYLGYGEWESHDDLMDHLSSDHFMDFAEFVDKNDIRWELQILKDLSYDVEDRQRKMGKKTALERGRDKEEMAHVLFVYTIPPGEDKDFVDQWTDTAYKTIEEDGNRIYSLRRAATDNTRFYGYGTWDSMRDYVDHFTSRHVDNFLSFVDDRDIVWFAAPLRKIGHQDE